jgi:release factor glutamine methyltransferase
VTIPTDRRERQFSTTVPGEALWHWRQIAQTQGKTAGIEPQDLDWLLRAVSDLDPLALRLGSFRQRPQVPLTMDLEQLENLWQQRLGDRVPVQYLVGETPWRDLTLAVSPAVLIPRPETELMVDLAVQAAIEGDLQEGFWVDMGTGSGAIAIGLALALPAIQVIAVDISGAALAIAAKNVERYDLGDRITLVQGPWFAPLAPYRGQISAMVSNPPYIPSTVLPTLQPEVISHEPTTALDGGRDGLDDIRTLVNQAPTYLGSGGLWLVEMMAGQGESLQTLLRHQSHYRDIRILADLAGRDRFALAYRR